MDKIVIFIIVVVVLVGAGFWAWQSKIFNGQELPSGTLLFYGQDCPHCKIVEEYIAQNKISEKLKFSNLEIPFNEKTSDQLVANSKLLLKAARICKIDTSNGVSIPFLFDGKGCLVGDQDIINFFKNAAGIK